MGTRSRIGLALGPDQIISVYCHYNGYIQHNGRILRDNYSTKQQVQELIDGGDMSCLHTRETWESKPLKQQIIKEDGTTEVKYMEHPNGSWMMDIEKEVPGTCTTVREVKMYLHRCLISMSFTSDNCGEEWCYLFTPGHGWQYWKLGWGDTNDIEYDGITEEPKMNYAV